MTREDLRKIEELDDEKLAALVCVEKSALEAHVSQHNAADAKVEKLKLDHESSITSLKRDHDSKVGDLTSRHAANLDRQSKLLLDQHLVELGKRDLELIESRTRAIGLTDELIEARALIDTLGGTELGQRMRKDAERNRLTKLIQEATRQLNDLK
jgi:hypothetical protein